MVLLITKTKKNKSSYKNIQKSFGSTKSYFAPIVYKDASINVLEANSGAFQIIPIWMLQIQCIHTQQNC